MNTVRHPGMAFAKPPKPVDEGGALWRVTVAFLTNNKVPGQFVGEAGHESTVDRALDKLKVQVREIGGEITAWHVCRVAKDG